MEFRLLGPVEVLDGGEPLALGGRQRRILLSILLVYRGEVVSTDRLVEELWGGDPPRTARKTVQAHVAHLRSALNDDREMLAGADGGYVIDVDDDAVDVGRFEALLETARSLRDSDPAAAGETLDRALGLFRGSPLAEVADDAASLRVEASRIEELRLAAVEELLDARLAAGDVGGVAAEAERLVAEHPLRERLWALLMLALYRRGRQSEALRAFSRLRQILADELGIEPSPELQRLEQRILEQDATLEGAATPVAAQVVTPHAAIRNPYKGLRAFDEADAQDFFGREELVRRLIERLEGRGPAGSLVVLTGPSGAGKSSAMRAGLIPALRERGYDVAVMFPGAHPLTALGRAIGEVAGVSSDEALQLVTSGDRPGSGALVVVADQLEELFTMADPADADQLLSLMAEAAGNSGSAGWVSTVRADFLDRLMVHPRLGPLLQDALVLVPPLQDHEITAAVVNPAERVGVSVEPELSAEIRREVAARPAALPLLQYALTDLFDRRRADRITVGDYRAAGGLSGALVGRADETYGRLEPSEQAAARQLLLRLIAMTDQGEEVRRRVDREELLSLPFDEATLESVIERLGRERLLVFDQDPESGRRTIEIAHEALITEWPRLAGWVEGARDDLRMRRRLDTAVREWLESRREESFLIRGVRLAGMEGWAEDSVLELTEDERRFLEESRRAEDAEARQRARRRRLVASALSVGALVALVLAAVAFSQARRAEEQAARAEAQARVAIARELAAAAEANLDGDPDLSINLALEAVEVTRRVDGTVLREAEEILHAAVQSSRVVMRLPGLRDVAYSPDGRVIVTTPGSGVTLHDAATGQPVLRLPVQGPAHLAHHPAAPLLAVAGQEPLVTLYDTTTGASTSTLISETGSTASVTFGPDGGLLAGLTEEGPAVIWDVGSGEELVRLSAGGGWGLDFSPDGRILAVPLDGETVLYEVSGGGEIGRVAGDGGNVVFSPDGSLLATTGLFGAVSIWELSSGERLHPLEGHDGHVKAVTFSADGAMVATGGDDGTARVWEVATGEERMLIAGQQASVDHLAFSPDGTRLASGGSTGTLVWDLTATANREVLSIAAHGAPLLDVAYSPDGSQIATAGEDGVARLWDANTGAEIVELATHRGSVADVVYSPGGAMLATASFDGTVKLWETSGRELRTLSGHEAAVWGVDFSPDGTRLLSVSEDGTGRVWDVATGETVTVFRGHTDFVYDGAWSPDGTLVVSVSNDFTARGWDPATGEELVIFEGHDENVVEQAFSPDGARVATAGFDGVARVWDVATGEEQLVLRGHAGIVLDVESSPDGTKWVTTSLDGTVRLWDAATGKEVLALRRQSPPVVRLAFHPDGSRLAGATIGGLLRVYTLDVDELVEIARDRVTRALTDAECRQYLHTEGCVEQ